MRSIEQAFDSRRRSAPATTATATTATAAPVRLTRRGRLAVVLAMLLLLVVAGFTLGRVSSQAAAPSRPLPTVTVHPGETLWQIAARVAPHQDRRVVVAQIEALNDLTDGHVMAGQELRLPR